MAKLVGLHGLRAFLLCVPHLHQGARILAAAYPITSYHHFHSDGFKYRNLTWATSQWINWQVYYYIPKRILNRPHISSYIHISGALKPPYRYFPAPLRSTPHGGRPGGDGGRLAADRGGGGQVWKQAGRGDWGAEQSADMMMCFKEVAFGNQRWLRNPH